LAKETLPLINGAVKMDLFHRLSGSRLLDELILLLSDTEPRKAILRLRDLDLLRFIHPGLTRTLKLDPMLKSVEETLGWYRLLYLDRPIKAWVVYFLALMDQLPKQAMNETLTRLRVPERQAKTIRIASVRAADLLRRLARRPAPRPAEITRLLAGVPDETVLFLMAKTKSDSVRRHLSAYVTTYRSVNP
jgi:tRNA nucleotidyltransferase (CCA-adding enzyme)